jgi:hypothetical protein
MPIINNVLLLFPLKRIKEKSSTYCGRCFFLWGEKMNNDDLSPFEHLLFLTAIVYFSHVFAESFNEILKVVIP